MYSWRDHENSQDILTGMLRVFSLDAYALLDPGANLSFMTPYLTNKFGICSKQLLEPFSVSTPIGKSIFSKRIYRNCTISINLKDCTMDIVELDMIDFDTILGMDRLYSCYASITCRTRVVKFQFLDKPALEWKGSLVLPKHHFISYLKARKLVTMGLSHLVRAKNFSVEIPSLQSVPIVNEFPEVFLNNLLGVPPKSEIDFGIDILPDTQPSSILP